MGKKYVIEQEYSLQDFLQQQDRQLSILVMYIARWGPQMLSRKFQGLSTGHHIDHPR
jgi:hypothetical protein